MSIAAIGSTGQDCPCTGYYIDPLRQAEAVAELLANAQPGRPTTLWLTGTLIDRQTTAPLKATNVRNETPPQMLVAASSR